MDDQNQAWRRLTDARLEHLEAAVKPGRIRRTRDGRELKPLPSEPGDRVPLPRWLEIRQMSLELLLRLILDADRDRADELDVDGLEDGIETDLGKLERWSRLQIEPDIGRRETMAMILLARVILTEGHTWPLIELEEMEVGKME
jgi:hypothetical protein